MKSKGISIITIPLVYYHEKIYWGLYTMYTGKVKNNLRHQANAGKQIPFAFEEAIKRGNDIVIVVDDKFNQERMRNEDPLQNEVFDFLQKETLPKPWLERINSLSILSKIVKPPEVLSCTKLTFSEKKLFTIGRKQHGLVGECACEWLEMLSWIKTQGYESVEAYIPKVCFNGICYATPIAQGSNIYPAPIEICFTDNSLNTTEQKWENGRLV